VNDDEPKKPMPKTPEEWFERVSYQNARKNSWKVEALKWRGRFYLALVVSLFLAIGCGVAICAVTMPRSESQLASRGQKASAECDDCDTVDADWTADDTAAAHSVMPPHTLATVILYNGGTQCSGAIISKGEKYGLGISAGHCFEGKIGGQFWVFRPDGHKAIATLLACNHDLDLALFRIPTADVLVTAPLIDEELASVHTLEIIGYPMGKGPKRLYLGQGTYSPSQHQWFVPTLTGKNVIPGNSGSSLFADGRVCGVVRGLPHQPTVTTGCNYQQLQDFIVANRRRLKGCRDGQCPLPAEEPGDTDEIAPPPGFNGITPPTNPPNWKPKPQGQLPQSQPTPAQILKVETPLYDGKGKPPEGLRTPHERSAAISILQHQKLVERVAELESELVDLKNQPPSTGMGTPGAPGPAGAPGQVGPAGVVDPAAVSAEVKKQLAAMPPQPGSSGGAAAKGDTGAKGDKGDPGTVDPAALAAAIKQAIAGIQLNGVEGPQGPAGPNGDAGPVGPSGPRGPVGPAGAQVDPATIAQIQSDITDLKKFRKNLTGSKITVPVLSQAIRLP
jgi:hypothetical protein